MFRLYWKKIAVALLGLSVLCIGTIFFLTYQHWTVGHWWRKVSGATVSYNGSACPHCTVWRSLDGNIFIRLSQQEELADEYIIFPTRLEVGVPNGGELTTFGNLAYSHDAPQLTVRMNTSKLEVDPKLIIESGRIEFRSAKEAKVELSLTRAD